MSVVAGLLIAVFVLNFVWWIVGGFMLAGVVHVVRAMMVSAAGLRERARREGVVVAGRADREHAAVLSGDESGVYGEFPPAVK